MESGVLQLILEYRYWILIPLSFVEGPIVAFFAGTLAAGGYFNIWGLAIFFLIRDMAVDLFCYWVGYVGANTGWINRLIRRLGVTDGHLDEVRTLWRKHPGKTMFLSKLSYGVAAGFIVVAGLVRSNLRQFAWYGFLTAIAHYGVLLFVGYFFGASFGGSILVVLENIPLVLGALTTIAIGYYFFKRYMSKKLEQAEAQAGREQ